MSIVASPHFYVYVLARPNGQPFYVGKGKGRRIHEHERMARSGHRCHKCSIIRKIWSQGGEVQRYIVFEAENEDEALAYEQEIIALHGRALLVNCTDGGEGIPNPSQEVRSKISEAGRRRPPPSDETRRRLSIGIKRFYQEHGGARRSAYMRERWQDPSYQIMQRTMTKGIPRPQSVRDKIKQTSKERFADPDVRRHRSEIARRRYEDPEERRKQSERMKEAYARRKIRLGLDVSTSDL